MQATGVRGQENWKWMSWYEYNIIYTLKNVQAFNSPTYTEMTDIQWSYLGIYMEFNIIQTKNVENVKEN